MSPSRPRIRSHARAALAAVLLAAAAIGGAAAPARALTVGIADNKPDMFADPRFGAAGIRIARLSVGWDALSSPWQLAEIDAWLGAAQAANVEPLVSFGHSRTDRRSLPTPERFLFEFRRFRARYPWVRDFATWNEGNHCGEPTCHRPQLVAAYYRKLRRECPGCRILAAEVLDQPNMVRWVRAFRHTAPRGAALLGAAQLHRRQPRPRPRHAPPPARGQRPDLVHGDGRHRRPAQPPQGDVPRVGAPCRDGDPLRLPAARPAQPPRDARLRLPVERRPAAADVGLGARRPDRPRPPGAAGAHASAPAPAAAPARRCDRRHDAAPSAAHRSRRSGFENQRSANGSSLKGATPHEAP